MSDSTKTKIRSDNKMRARNYCGGVTDLIIHDSATQIMQSLDLSK